MPSYRITAAAIALLVLGHASPANAEMIFGAIHQGGRPIANASLQLQCPWGSANASTDGNGGFRLTTSQSGSCVLVLNTGNGSASAPVDFYDEPTRYDFEFNGSGQLLQR